MTWLRQIGRGLCIGVAEAIPGVSGGTIALILGIHSKLIRAISGVGVGMARAALEPAFWRRLAGLPGSETDGTIEGHVENASFLLFLGLGIVVAVAVGSRFVPTLLDLYPSEMKALFLGLVLASSVIPFAMIKTRGRLEGSVLVVAMVGTFCFVGLPVDDSQHARGELRLLLPGPAYEEMVLPARAITFLTDEATSSSGAAMIAFGPQRDFRVRAGEREVIVPVVARLAGARANLAPGSLRRARGLPDGVRVVQLEPTAGGVDPAPWFLFLAGALAVGAMILPGISGAFILLLLGLYHYLAFNLRLLLFEQDSEAALVVVTVLAAVAVGLMTSARVLLALLSRFPDPTLAALVGLMLGSLRRLWPFNELRNGRDTNVLPSAVDGHLLGAVIAFVSGLLVIFVIERLRRTRPAL